MLMMMTTIPSPHLMRTDTKRAKTKERSERISSVFNRTNNNVDDDIQTSSRFLAQKGEKKRPLERGVQTNTHKKQTGLNFTYLDCILSIVCAELGGLLPVAVLFAFASISCITRAFERVRVAAEPPPPSSLIIFFDDNSPPFWAFSLSFFQN